jgi:hypothetical protein
MSPSLRARISRDTLSPSASNRGSMPELIDHGVTGSLVNSVDEAVEAIGRIGEINRARDRSLMQRGEHQASGASRLILV